MSLDLRKPPKGKKYVYTCPFNGCMYNHDSELLLGLGNPPRSPNQPIGSGSTPMQMSLVDEATKTEDSKTNNKK